MVERSVHGNAVNEDIIYELPPVEESWECDAANLPTSWKPCESCGYIFDPTNPHRLLVAFTENDEGVIQFTNASGHNGFQIVADTTFKQSRAKQHWKWMHGLRWNPANSVRQDSAKDIAQVTKVKSIIDRHRQCPGVVQQPQGDARVARNAPEPSSTANRSGYMHTRRISVIQTPQSEPSHERPRRSSGQGGGHDRRKRARTSTPNVPTPESRVPLSTAQVSNHSLNPRMRLTNDDSLLNVKA